MGGQLLASVKKCCMYCTHKDQIENQSRKPSVSILSLCWPPVSYFHISRENQTLGGVCLCAQQLAAGCPEVMISDKNNPERSFQIQSLIIGAVSVSFQAVPGSLSLVPFKRTLTGLRHQGLSLKQFVKVFVKPHPMQLEVSSSHHQFEPAGTKLCVMTWFKASLGSTKEGRESGIWNIWFSSSFCLGKNVGKILLFYKGREQMYPVQCLCKKSTRLLSECNHGLLGSAKYAMDAEQAWLGTENVRDWEHDMRAMFASELFREFMSSAGQKKPF